MYLFVGNEGAVYTNRQTGTRRQIEHVAVTKQLFGTTLIEDGARIDFARYLERHTGRDVGLDQAGNHVHRRALRGEDQVDAGRAGFLRDTGDQLFDLLADDHHHVGKFVHHHNDGRQRLQRWRLVVHAFATEQRIGQRCAGFFGVLDLAIEAREVTHAHRRHQFVTALHLGDAPTQGVGGLFHVGNDRAEQVRNTFVDRQLEHLRVDHDKPRLFWRGLEQDRKNHRVDAHRLTGAGRTGHQQVRHLREVGDNRLAADIVAQSNGDRRFGVVIRRRRKDLGEAHDLAILVGNLDTYGGLARNDFDHTYTDHRQGARKILRQIGNAADLDACRGLDLKPGNDWAWMNGLDDDLDAKLLELDLQ